MKTLTDRHNPNPVFFLGYATFSFLVSCFCFSIPKNDGFLLINHYHCMFFDFFFEIFTGFGNGLFVILVMTVAFLKRKKEIAFQIGISFAISGILAQLLKIMFHMPRPMQYFGSHLIHCYAGFTRTGFTSFPSGHTASIFALTTVLSFYFPGKLAGFLLVLVAIFGGVSRVYLSSHYPVDVLFGALLGVASSLLTLALFPESIFQRNHQRIQPIP